MCIACLEYTKDRLNVSEFSFALREMTQEDKAHYEEVARLLKEHGNNPAELKKQLEALKR